MDNNEYLGKGLKFPFKIISGQPTIITGVSIIEQSISRILNTPVGSTFFRREYGSRLSQLKGKPFNLITENLLEIVIKEAIETWEQRVKFETVTFKKSDGVINCFITYKILASNEIKTFVYPFYNKLD